MGIGCGETAELGVKAGPSSRSRRRDSRGLSSISVLATALAQTAVASRLGLSTWIPRTELPASRSELTRRGAAAASGSLSLRSLPTVSRKARLSARCVMFSIS
jgi:hypothetical protein